jgi:hypothetical protein
MVVKGHCLQDERRTEIEVFGVSYERYALQKLFLRLTRRLRIRTVLEMPASGAKAMPSLYSLGFALAGCDVTLVDADPAAVELWRALGLQEKLRLLTQSDAEDAQRKRERWDLCWNFAVLPSAAQPDELLKRMADLTDRWLLVVNVNRFNVGFFLHRAVHRIYRIPWTHGDISFLSPFYLCRRFRQLGFAEPRWDVVDCPPWPDSPGFRDLRLHRRGEGNCNWVSPYIQYLASGEFPAWMRAVYIGEKLPLPPVLKLPYAHLYYAFCRVHHDRL